MSGTGNATCGARFSTFRIRRTALHGQLSSQFITAGRYAVAGREPVTIHPQDATTRRNRRWRYGTRLESSRAGSGGRGRYRDEIRHGVISVFTKAHGRGLNLPQAAYAKRRE